jgi:nucleotide-binding universal stress UspA family protein
MIVVGVDGSKSARIALAWAFAEARLREDTVRIICSWHVPAVAYGTPGFVPAVEGGLDASFERAAEQAMAETLDLLADESAGIAKEQRIVEGPAAQVLIEAAKDADLLVVGSRGHGGFAGLLLGSVSQQCAQHATCPVVIVRK